MSDWDKLSEQQRAQFDEALTFLETANHPTGSAQRAQLAQMQIPRDTIRKVAAYRAWKYGLDKPSLDSGRLEKEVGQGARVNDTARQVHEETQANLLSAFDKFAGEDKKTEQTAKQQPTTGARAKEMLTKRRIEKEKLLERDGVKIPEPRSDEQKKFAKWLRQNKVKDPFHQDQHYDYVGAFRAGEGRAAGEEGHFTDRFKLPGHETFSNESQYAIGENAAKAGRWDGDKYIPPGNLAEAIQSQREQRLAPPQTLPLVMPAMRMMNAGQPLAPMPNRKDEENIYGG